MNDLVAKSQIINNLLATQAGNVLDATQGKALKDEIDQLNSDLNSRTAVSDLNTAVDVSPHAPLIVQCDANTLNPPYKAGLTSSASGTAYITGGSDSNYLTMFYVPASDPNMFIRSRSSGKWYDWGHIIKNADFQNMIQALYVTASAPGQYGHVSVTATVPEGYKFLCWLQSITSGWAGNCNPSTQSATTDFYTSVGSGGTLRCWYLVIKT